ncbi:MAG: S41 family peptidase [Pseudomonadota bacterium]
MTNLTKTVSQMIFIASSLALAQTAYGDEDLARYKKTAQSINETIQAYHYNPDELDTDEYEATRRALAHLAGTAQSDESFLNGFRAIWEHGPFSHVDLNKARGSAEDLAVYLDDMDVGGNGAILTWQGDTAILTVNTMMGADTIKQLEDAYDTIEARSAEGLIIDLRHNEGGAFAVRPLVEHLISEPFVAGGFVSQQWNGSHERRPTLEDMKQVAPWNGWSIRRFWSDAQDQPLTVVQFEPASPVFEGSVFILTSAQTASAAELATDALKSANRAIIVGETTAGKMLSQKIYDVEGGFHLSLPIADYYSAVSGRIEGVGIEPDMPTPSYNAMEVAISLTRK